MTAANYGPWVIVDEGQMIVRRQMLDDHGHPCGWILLDGDTDGITAPLVALRAMLIAFGNCGTRLQQAAANSAADAILKATGVVR